jgi:hypothetical protein
VSDRLPILVNVNIAPQKTVVNGAASFTRMIPTVFSTLPEIRRSSVSQAALGARLSALDSRAFPTTWPTLDLNQTIGASGTAGA